MFMDKNIIIGCILIFTSLIFITAIILWSRKTINKICDKGPGSHRKIMKELKDGR